MFERILVPVDLSERAAEPVRVAGEMARVHGSAVTLLHVIETVDLPYDELRDFYQELEKKARAHLDALAAPLKNAGVAADAHVRYGKRTPEIITMADDEGFDLVVIGSHRLSREHFASGFMTISHQVAIVAHTPVLIVKR